MEKKIISNDQKQFRVVGLTIFLIMLGLVAMRLLSTLISKYISSDIVLDLVFTLPLQLGILLIFPFLMYKFALKKSFKEVLSFSSFRKTKLINILIAIGIGVCAFIVTIGVSLMWQLLITLLGYTNTSGGEASKPIMWQFLLSLFLTAVLPAICEEFATRGGLLTTYRKSYSLGATLLLSALTFGLFHQNITQVFYTALFGALMAYITLKTGSIYPSIIIHFLNNGINVYLDYASAFKWWGGNFLNSISQSLIEGNTSKLAVIVLIFLLAIAGLIMLIFAIKKINTTKQDDTQYEILCVAANGTIFKPQDNLDPFNTESTINSSVNQVNNSNEIDPFEDYKQTPPINSVNSNNGPYGNYGGTIPLRYIRVKKRENLFKPSLRDGIFFIGALAITIAATIFTFVWGAII